MSMPVSIQRRAQSDLAQAVDWYEQRRSGWGAVFAEAVQDVLDTISANPYTYAEVYPDAREAMLSGFPYIVYYRIEPTEAVVFAIVHAARNPSLWQSRLGDSEGN